MEKATAKARPDSEMLMWVMRLMGASSRSERLQTWGAQISPIEMLMNKAFRRAPCWYQRPVATAARRAKVVIAFRGAPCRY